MEHHQESLFADPRTWVGVAFVIFFFIFGRKIWVTLTGILDKRAAGIRDELEAAARLRQEAEAMLKDATAKRAAADREASTMLTRAHEEAARLAEASRGEAAAATARRERMALDRIAAAEKAAVTEVRLAAAEIAGKAAQDVIARDFDTAADGALIDRAIQGLPAALSGRRAA